VDVAQGWVASCAGLAVAAGVEGEQRRITNPEVPVFDIFPYGTNNSGTFMSEDCREINHGKEPLLKNNVGVT